MRALLLLCIFSMATRKVLYAQKDTVAWFTQPGVTLLNGDKYTSAAITAVTGVHYKQWYLGVGAGIDYYKVRSIPLLAELRFESKLKAAPFVYARAGYNVAWALEHQHTKPYVFWGTNSVFNNGKYAAAGLGCYVYRKDDTGVALTLGYSAKGVTELYDETIWNGTRTVTESRKLDYVFRRLDIGVSYRF
ncbi:hypothetical protein HNQ91_006000 [Filimonas zeae]|uniref:Outer membrane protein beta-barrel domain-containing protein n=1 Tax=Filimonas zeae TaxID=1737353 RepID=A0A917MZW2_9BACT|nr:hypothetical protein [Filimonas zeae]MDR6342913.1 hypothetical protein [Filimonas zeae]GGH83208.1 hypothetical protein GCM10011379_58250 [Filimonas zeae]